MKKIYYYVGLFVLSYVIQWFWYTQIMTKSNKTPLDMLLSSVVFIAILFFLDLGAKIRKRN
ncbi:hypothetical protein [Sporolactobacillus laevolacticus]|jgi:hypothetical protein|uniref:hypothetical protein n=1 Tax=Sporolactobacillus laevolacticus TaxID=33018 RepID=UPI0025B33BB7|nr:hypothetical protein [Sporolactobacillus laevolacticus]MDN3956453.1 hypothetical protein [Sporolactobacillus laevolacticus]